MPDPTHTHTHTHTHTYIYIYIIEWHHHSEAMRIVRMKNERVMEKKRRRDTNLKRED
jgi:hypothetical protein